MEKVAAANDRNWVANSKPVARKIDQVQAATINDQLSVRADHEMIAALKAVVDRTINVAEVSAKVDLVRVATIANARVDNVNRAGNHKVALETTSDKVENKRAVAKTNNDKAVSHARVSNNARAGKVSHKADHARVAKANVRAVDHALKVEDRLATVQQARIAIVINDLATAALATINAAKNPKVRAAVPATLQAIARDK